MSAEHHVEVFTDASFPDPHSWGWQCFTCNAEKTGFDRFSDAEHAANEHFLSEGAPQ